MIYRKARAGELTEESLKRLAVLTEINVEEVGVYGAKEFFEAKVGRWDGTDRRGRGLARQMGCLPPGRDISVRSLPTTLH